MLWTDEREQTVRKLWSEGLSASQIATQLGGISRNAVIGKVHRLKLSSRGRANPAPSRQKKPAQQVTAKPAPRPAFTSIGATSLQTQFDTKEPASAEKKCGTVTTMPICERVPENIVVPISRNLVLVQLNEHTCKWPLGDPLEEEFHFCGNDSDEHGPYCRYHARIAFQPASERRRIR